MTVSIVRPSLWQQLWWKVQPVRIAGLVCPGFHDLDRCLPDDVRAYLKDSYPHNHTFTATNDRLVPGRKLAERIERLARHYPRPMTSLVDLSCSKGYFVFHAARLANSPRVLGIDLDGRSLEVCRLLEGAFDGRDQIAFARLTLPELALRIDEFGGPFQTALLVNTYQYLILGSSVAPAVSHDHAEVFRLLRQVCNGRLIFHNRLSLDDLQSDPRERAGQLGRSFRYEPEVIHAAASHFFHIQSADRTTRRPVWVMDAK
ncbi:MAG: hypothetical protein ACKV0T_29205 [Planctomycetales bacterium]